MTETSGVRAFLAVPPDPAWSDGARALLARIRPSLPDASWTRPESWHLTLRFFGNVSRDRLAAFAAAFAVAAGRLAQSRLSASGTLTLPPRGPSRVLAVGFLPDAGSACVARMAREAESSARKLGLEPERREFRPHVTFARLRRPWPAEAIARFRSETDGWAFPVWAVRSCVLYESRLDRGGAIHMPVAQWDLPAAETVPA